jgi:hypothetical protein
MNGDFATLHLRTEQHTRVAIDDNLSATQPGANLVATIVRTGEAQALRVLTLHFEHIANGYRFTRSRNRQRFDFFAVQSVETTGHQWRQVKPLRGPSLELETKRAHPAISLRWK